MRVLVTGGSGFVGAAVSRALLAGGYDVRVLARRPPPSDSWAAETDWVQGDLRDAELVGHAVDGCEAVEHVAAKVDVWGPFDEFHAINVRATSSLLRAARRAGVRYFVATSTPAVVHSGAALSGVDEGQPIAETHSSNYAATKGEMERLVIGANDDALRTLVLRPHLVWGPGDSSLLPRLARRAVARRLYRLGPCDPTVDLTYISDAAAAHVCALEQLAAGADVAGRPYFITGGQPIGLYTMMSRLLQALDLPPIRRAVPLPLTFALARVLEAVARVGRSGEPLLTTWIVEEMSRDHWFDISAARALLGYIPAVTIDDGIAELRAWWVTGGREITLAENASAKHRAAWFPARSRQGAPS